VPIKGFPVPIPLFFWQVINSARFGIVGAPPFIFIKVGWTVPIVGIWRAHLKVKNTQVLI
jgi:hypothetical protein